jgi:hypothetical protein
MTSAMEIALVGPSQLSEAHDKMQGPKIFTYWLEQYLIPLARRKMLIFTSHSDAYHRNVQENIARLEGKMLELCSRRLSGFFSTYMHTPMIMY